MSDDTAGGDEVGLPEPVRSSLVRTAAEVLGQMEPKDVPVALRQVQRFAPRRRSSAGAQPLWQALQHDDGFRGRVARVWSHARPELADAVAAGLTTVPDPDAPPLEADEAPAPAADGVELAVGAWLLRPAGWQQLARAAVADQEPDPDGGARAGSPGGRALEMMERRAERAELEAARVTAQLGAARLEASSAQEEAAALRREQRRLRSDADRARSEARAARSEAQALRAEARALLDQAAADSAAAAADRRVAEAERAASRGEARLAQDIATARARLLLDTVVDAGTALRHELGLPPVAVRPADTVATQPGAAANRPTSRGRQVQDPALLDDLLALPHAHLVVDGYNVSKAAYPQLSLTDQRRRLLDALSNVAARTGAEVTCCFDGQPGHSGAATGPRNVRALFSVGEIADDLIRRIVRAEPPGRVVVVVTSDQEIATDVQASGAWAVPSQTLLARLARL
ncbi:NYN domain-containing protein [Cellulomonas chengniuliangii]|uniref:NYN domain-containing protein n=1 Tax=Cellulomonas chengniuliangii TaxID=2968084 RepID=UPI001D0EE7AC|nr:NYN domain-containing protein [Cellulomonas chengniuliangii]MCC2317618.1 NYN domain-containing protein [Cellulomonas chengniuliangii]